MNLQAAKSMLITERMDWNRPHLRWISEDTYRSFSFAKMVSGFRR